MSLVWRIVLIAVAVLMASLGALAYFSGRAMSAELAEALQSRSQAVAKNLAIQLERIMEYGLPLDHIEGFEDQLSEVLENDDGLSYALVVDNAGKVIFHRDHGQAQGRIGASWPADAGGIYRNAQADARKSGGVTVGRVVVGYRAEQVTERIAQIERDSILLALAVFAVGVALLVAALRMFVQRPLLQFAHTIEQVRRGGTLAPRVRNLRQQEFRSVAASFNTMLEELERQAEELRQAKPWPTRPTARSRSSWPG